MPGTLSGSEASCRRETGAPVPRYGVTDDMDDMAESMLELRLSEAERDIIANALIITEIRR